MDFSNIGEHGEDISVNLRIDHGKTQKTVIIIGDKPLIINPKGEIEKSTSMRYIGDNGAKEKGFSNQYYTQNEIDELNAGSQFSALKNELKKYIDYINLRYRKIAEIREKKTENIPGSVNKYKSLIDSIKEEFTYFKTHINKLSERASDKDCFRIMNKIKTFHAQNSIMLKDALPDGRSLYLVFSAINRKKAMKLFIMDYNNKNIDKSFIIYENKLAKYTPK